MSKILVTGAAGFMGSHLLEKFVKDDHHALGLDNFSTGYKANVMAPTVELDLLDKEKLDMMMEDEKFDTVFHLAAWAHEGLSQFSPVLITENNYNATLNLLKASIKSGVKKFVFTSSMSVYGEGQPPFDETHPRNPVDIYGVAKTASERAIEILCEVHGMEYTIIRPHNVYGIRQNISDPYRNVVGIFIRRVLQNQPIIIYGDGKQTRAFSHISDVTPAIANALTQASGEIVNVGPRTEYSVQELAETVAQIHNIETNKKVEIQHVPDRPLEVKHAYCTHDKAQKFLDYKTRTSFYDGLSAMYYWAKDLSENGGIAKPSYLDELELISKDTPITWLKKTL